MLSNGSVYLESVGPQDEGHYICRANNRIGSGLNKVIYIGVNGKVFVIIDQEWRSIFWRYRTGEV